MKYQVEGTEIVESELIDKNSSTDSSQLGRILH